MPATLTTHPFQVGAIVVNSWGYDQTNVDFWQVIRATDKSVRLHRIGRDGVPGSDGFMCNRVVPVRDQFLSKRFDWDDEVEVTKFPKSWTWHDKEEWTIHFRHGSGSLHVEGESHYCSWYA